MVTGELSIIDGVGYYRIDGAEDMPPFLMTVVSHSDLWMFVSSAGALTAGRRDADHAIFPYETDDRLHRAAELAGPVTVIARTVAGARELWRPFGRNVTQGCVRSIAKSVLGDRLVFEEHHHGWETAFRVTWTPSDTFGWVRTVEVIRAADSDVEFDVLDGLLDVMPAGVDAHTEQIRSNLVDAYKRSETGPWGTLAVYSVESLITDRAEPAESLTANVVWSSGFDDAVCEVDDRAVADMVTGRPSARTTLVTGRPGAYLLRGRISLPASGSRTWTMVADVGLGHREVLAAVRAANDPDAHQRVIDDVEAGSAELGALLEGADAFQSTGDPLADAHHLSNVLFNSMRGGVFPDGNSVPVADFVDFVGQRNRPVVERRRSWLDSLGAQIDVVDLRSAAIASDDPDLVRLVLEYLPLTFSRRHGDPSRPWNRFSINVHDDEGGRVLAYEGNWRDIFQNWEALLHSYPSYFVHVVAKFVNATTFDGYNPYRISRDGIDWEVPDPDDPWSHIGYWGDHQIVYLLRLLEAWREYEPGAIAQWLDRRVFVYADVPYVIADHDAIVHDPRNTITYDDERAETIARREGLIGADARLVVGDDAALLRVGLLEKLLVPALAKLSNFVPGGGVWLNTQRPEWNDANNALAGPGLSMVTLYHLHRYLRVLHDLIDDEPADAAALSASVATWLSGTLDAFEGFPTATEPIDDRERRRMVDTLGRLGSEHRRRQRTRTGHTTVDVALSDIRRLCDVVVVWLDESIRSGRRADGLFHSYNRVSFPTHESAHVDHLGPMLEGQVAVLSSGALDAHASLAVIDALFASDMYRDDQDTFMLYPATVLPSFLSRNRVPDEVAQSVPGSGGDVRGPFAQIFTKDADGHLHFRPGITNAGALAERLDRAGVPHADRDTVMSVYEEVFDHRSFTGRSGSMYGYEGIGSVYWHMVAKLLLAVQETYWAAVDTGEPDDVVDALRAAYRRVRSGLGFQKGPATFGAIPTDCYSHTPAHAGAQQPGMTGQVKEEVLTRFGELGIRVVDGRVTLAPGLAAPTDVFRTATNGRAEPARFTVCAVPMTIGTGATDSVGVLRADGRRESGNGLALDRTQSLELFGRTGTISRVDWTIGDDTMGRWRRHAGA